ncbi:hypothetical protein [Streptomyces sp. H27-C3]|uniref:hypothetical protein n=1 Tax=Streptomyces sp. H27-C3 TaxID=3046305 RepID=UPI0024B8F6BD|nr:hypothetical protein [Streptomyces sp. H27-C3]MDJ0463516.1 hypothetical protein [Streptomyces sp. H27-C3]
MAQAPSVIVPYVSYLRVYEPLAAFPEPERGYWAGYARRGHLPTAQDELRRSLADLLPTPPVAVPVHESGDAFVAELDGVVCVCPWRTRLRGWLALQELPELFPEPLLDAALPPVVRRQAAADFERWLERNPDARPWIRSSVWHVPVSWFALFAGEERTYTKAREGSAPTLSYRTPMAQARRRVARALKALRELLGDGGAGDGDSAGEGEGGVEVLLIGGLVDRLVDVGRWLEEFHPRSLVELDYGGLVHTVPEVHLADDVSAADVAEGIAALRAGDGAGAGEAYERLMERWRTVRERQFAN